MPINHTSLFRTSINSNCLAEDSSTTSGTCARSFLPHNSALKESHSKLTHSSRSSSGPPAHPRFGRKSPDHLPRAGLAERRRHKSTSRGSHSSATSPASSEVWTTLRSPTLLPFVLSTVSQLSATNACGWISVDEDMSPVLKPCSELWLGSWGGGSGGTLGGCV